MLRVRALVISAALALVPATLLAEGLQPIPMPNKQSTHLPPTKLHETRSFVPRQPPQQHFTAPPWTHAPSVNFKSRPDPWLRPHTISPHASSFHHSRFSARPFDARTTLPAMQVEIPSRFATLPPSQPMTPALLPEPGPMRFEPHYPATAHAPAYHFPSWHDASPLFTAPPPAAPSPAITARAASPAPPAPDSLTPAAPLPKTPTIDYGELLWRGG